MTNQGDMTVPAANPAQGPSSNTEASAAHGAQPDATAQNGHGGGSEPEVFSKEDVDRLVQSESDRRVTAALQTYEKRLRAELDAELERKNEEFESARLKEQGRYQELFERSQAELEGLKAEVAAKDFRNRATAALVERGVPELAEILLGDLASPEAVAQAGDALAGLIEGKVAAAVAERLQTGAPVQGGASVPAPRLADLNPAEFEEWKRAHGIF